MAYKVLIVDDEEIVCRGMAQFVKWQEHDFEVVGTAYNVDDAMVLLNQLAIDVVFMDIRMPGKTGLDLLQMIQKRFPNIKSIILSGFSEFSYAREAMRYGAVDYLNKPVNLKEIEELLKRLKVMFMEEKKEQEIRANRVEALLLSAAKGYAKVEQEKYELPVFKRWYGIALGLLDRAFSEQEIKEKKQEMRLEIGQIVPGAYILDSHVYGVFAIIPYKEESEVENFINMITQICSMNREWICGVSKTKNGVENLREAYQEAERALNYQKAGERRGLVCYKNIEPLFSQNTPEVQDVISRVMCMLTNPEKRNDAPKKLENDLRLIWNQGFTIMQFQTICIQYLIELNSFHQGLKIKNADLHRQLNQTLREILLSNDFEATIVCMIDHIKNLVNQLNEADEQQLGKGVIKEIQLFILTHYGENITLNMLAEQFYLHPNYLSRFFKEKTGKNFIEYLTEVRMEKVKELLVNTDNKVVDISLMVGYDNPRYFSKVFKQFTGMTPSEYREKL